MRAPRTAAGKRLLAEQNAALARTSSQTGEELVWSEAETVALERAGETVDRAETVRKLLQIQMRADEPNPSIVVKLSAEIRALDRLVVDLVGKLNPYGEGQAKSDRHQRAANARWSRADDAKRWQVPS
ncbi:hypothetical protein [Rhodococcus sp. H29-C3]|uniref:hypothetical protein n=1 Tax=Rhodococcus sp. H29-C3 TaxID=3046307 RepID=UPI0024BAA8B1|nr:hypothetical protein [Rhodococcus sp. H29-C3]MDJ0359697.1 hypothetical protein [Rhodococcus sp. H29-C3]